MLPSKKLVIRGLNSFIQNTVTIINGEINRNCQTPLLTNAQRSGGGDLFAKEGCPFTVIRSLLPPPVQLGSLGTLCSPAGSGRSQPPTLLHSELKIMPLVVTQNQQSTS